jgi:hypothetical protein
MKDLLQLLRNIFDKEIEKTCGNCEEYDVYGICLSSNTSTVATTALSPGCIYWREIKEKMTY